MLRLAVRVRREHAELALAELISLAPGGVEEVSLGDVVEYAVYGAPGELPSLPDLRAAAGAALVEVSTMEIADDWAERWRAFHVPLVVDGALTVRPPWAAPATTPLDVVIDPGQAFGTGAHASTRLCLELLLGIEPSSALLDLGCGSGVLAIVAAKLGWAPVTAVDNDQASLEATRANAAVNSASVDVRRVDLRTDPVPAATTVTANLLTPLLLAWVERMGAPEEPTSGRLAGENLSPDLPRRVIASGLLVDEADRVAEAFARRGLVECERRVSGEWAALSLLRDGGSRAG
jgi:ribosomal protein L11 methyltransferase